ncbi:GTPase-activating protein gyp8 [Yamadazyma tenuis]|uniref:Rab-GAP TBC domain-containing protein n=1 Tax=Candida tenuis (strain ATCC 10573 / BCRC 21748 / CBS 615 / JCM 9827 / NBRC 10315 / NRRL Y-1498 / VKM Y-70) TaxID=590646 RepID=G3BB54_CANTC|nr:uncharacterized protein CANTEDRAFT_108496 [Yamadazyma tenuis ATCC 10573]EGV62142.1 hypothetical protein CANTEDRAFT_108496 [Yamadazyma tenuis ATCC 10573]WEJ93402.1 GTPase-activating protein gyp8 [Yamadazyma tenuis]
MIAVSEGYLDNPRRSPTIEERQLDSVDPVEVSVPAPSPARVDPPPEPRESLLFSGDPHNHTTTQTSIPRHPSDSNDSQQDWVSMDVDKFGKSFYTSETGPLNDQIKSLKTRTLYEYLNSCKHNEIIEYSRSTDGLVNNDIRRGAWPVLLGLVDWNEPGDTDARLVSSVDASMFLEDLSINDVPLHKDEEQVKLDIKRSFTILNHIKCSFASLPQTDSYSDEQISYLKKTLLNLVVKLLRKYPSLHYYQGFHDIASIILVVCYDPTRNKVDETRSFKLLEALTLNHLRDFMISDINLSLVHLKLIPTVLEIVDHRFFKLVKQLSNSYVASDGAYYDYSLYQGLSCILTLFSHDINDLGQLLMLWDFSLSYHSVLINIYIYVAALMFKRDEIFKALHIKDSDNNFANVDKDLLHNLLSSNSLFRDLTDSDMVKILNKAKHYYETYPIMNLSNSTFTYELWFKQYNKSSVLLTTSVPYRSSPDGSLANDPKVVQQYVETQDREMARLMVYNLETESKVFEDHQLEESTDFDTSLNNSLSSSMSSLHSSTASLNTKILKTSSMYFKKLLFSDSNDDSEGPPIKRNNVFKLTTLYKISLTVGFLGFLLHFLVTRQSHNVILKYFDMNLNSFKLSSVGGWLNRVGLGNVRNSLYGYSG